MSAALAPQHLDDLKKSGLSDTTIAKLQIMAVRPHDIKIKGVESAYALPYFDLDGSVNGFQRRKLFPPITTNTGTMRYWQPPNTAPHVYLPPLLSWSHAAKLPKTVLTFTEGEKKAAAACQHGLIAAGIGGVWNWRQRLVDGEVFIVPMLDQFIWPGRTVELCPDSDVWRPDKQHALSGFFAFGQELQQRGATVKLVVLPDLHGTKCGLDDWLIEPGHDVEHSWLKLERIALDDGRFNRLNSWWQKWKEKQATQAAIQQHDTDDLDLSETAGLYTVHSKTHAVKIVFERLSESRGGVYAEVTVTLGSTELLSGVDLGLKSDSGQTKLVAGLKHLAATIPWKLLLQRACSAVLKRHRHGEPIVELQPSSSVHVPFLLNPLIYRGHQTLLYAPGGTCKSYLALWLALITCHGVQHANVAGVKSSVLYLDWELNHETVGGRLKALQAGHPELSHVRPFYRRCELPLHQEAHTVAAFVHAHEIKLLIVDSAAMACGGELSSPDAAINLQRALRKIGCASLVLAHVAKNTQEGQEKTAYGTVFFRELARNVWELNKSEDPNPVKLALSQPKNNFGPKHDALGFSLTFSDEQVRIEAQDLAAEPEFQGKLPTPARIRNLLEDGELRTSKEIADALNKPLASIQATLSNKHYKGIKWQMLGENRDARWTVLTLKTDS